MGKKSNTYQAVWAAPEVWEKKPWKKLPFRSKEPVDFRGGFKRLKNNLGSATRVALVIALVFSLFRFGFYTYDQGLEAALSSTVLKIQAAYFLLSTASWGFALAWICSAYPALKIKPDFKGLWHVVKQNKLALGFVFFLMMFEIPYVDFSNTNPAAIKTALPFHADIATAIVLLFGGIDRIVDPKEKKNKKGKRNGE